MCEYKIVGEATRDASALHSDGTSPSAWVAASFIRNVRKIVVLYLAICREGFGLLLFGRDIRCDHVALALS